METFQWVNIISEIVRNYTNKKHSRIKMEPYYDTKNIILITYNPLMTTGPRKSKNGDIVRISEAKHIFDEYYTSN